MRSRNLLIFFLLLALGAIGAMYVVGRSAQKAAAGLKTFVFASAADAQKLDPADVTDPESVKVLSAVCEGLVRFKSGTTQVEPCLAESWSISADGCLAIFAIREGVKFHDGTPLTPETAAWSFRRQMDPQAPGHFPGAKFARWQSLYSDIEEVRPLDGQRLQIKLKRANAALLANLAIAPAFLISPKSLADYGEGLQRHPVGTGPFKFKEWLPNNRIVLEGNPEYWGAKKRGLKLGAVVFKVVPDPAMRLAQMQTIQGGVHAMDGVDPATLPIIAGDSNLRLAQSPGLNLAYLAFNCRKGPMTNIVLRRAVAMAINRPKWVEEVYQGAAVEARDVLPPGIADHIAAQAAQADKRHEGTDAAKPPEELPFDVEQARGLVAQMQVVVRTVQVATNNAYGLPVTIETNVIERVELPALKLNVMNEARPFLPQPERAAQLLKASLEAIGLKVEVVPKAWDAHLGAVRAGEHDLALHGWVGDNGDPDNFLSIVDPAVIESSGAANICFYENAELAAMLGAGRSEMDALKRARIYKRAMGVLRDRLPVLPLAHAMDMVVLRSRVRGFVQQPLGGLQLWPVSVK